MHVAIAENNQQVLEIVYELRKVSSNNARNALLAMDQCMACAIHYGRLVMLKWMMETAKKEPERWVWEENFMMSPIERRDFAMMQFLYENCPRASTRIDYHTLKQAMVENDLELIK